MNCARELCPDFKITAVNQDAVNKVFNYAMRIPTEGIDLQKGLLLCGTVGTGKTTLLQAVSKFIQLVGQRNERGVPYDAFAIFSAMRVCMQFASEGFNVLELHCGSNRAFDELGAEPHTTNYYGTPVNVFEYLMQIRYDRRREFKTHITTNMTMSDIANRYGDRIEDRFVEIFNLIEMNGVSFRK